MPGNSHRLAGHLKERGLQSGYIKLYRKLHQSKIWLSEPFTRAQAWVDLILLANYKPGYIRVRGNRVDINRGQCGWSQARLAERWKWSRGKVIRFLDELETEHQIVQHKNRITSCISITNYEQYQSCGTTDGTTDVQQTEQQTDTNKKDKKENKEIIKENNKRKTSLPSNFQPNHANIIYAEKNNIDMDTLVEKFKANALANGKQYVDWHAGLRTWMINEKKWREKTTVANHGRIQRSGFEQNNYSEVF